MATVTPAGVGIDQRTLALMVRTMFPHANFPDGPYERTAAAIVEAAQTDVRTRAQLEQGMRELDVAGGAPFAQLEPDAAPEVLRGISGTAFFEAVRSKTILTLYDDPEVWSLLGYEGPSFEHGGYLQRGFDDLDWLPDPRVEEAGS
jgi:hypothetical protein